MEPESTQLFLLSETPFFIAVNLEGFARRVLAQICYPGSPGIGRRIECLGSIALYTQHTSE